MQMYSLRYDHCKIAVSGLFMSIIHINPVLEFMNIMSVNVGTDVTIRKKNEVRVWFCVLYDTYDDMWSCLPIMSSL